MAEEKKQKKGEEEQQEAAAAPAPAKSGKSKLIFIIAGVVVLVLAVGMPVLYMSMKSASPEDELSSAAGQEDAGMAEGSLDEDELDEGEDALGGIFPMESFVVNLRGGGYIRLQIQVEFIERDIPKRFYVRLVPIRDAIIRLLANRSAEDLAEEKGRDALRKDIKNVIEEILKKADVKNVYFTQFVVQ